jgi:carboxypeptidase Taq
LEEKLNELKARLIEVNDLEAASALLSWDQSTYMPPGGAVARGRQLATLGQIAHEKFTDPAIGRLLDELRPYQESLPPDSDDSCLIRVAQRDYERAVKVPPAFVAEFSSHAAASYEAWTRARPDNDFAAMRPLLEKTLDLSRQYAEFFPGYAHIADPLIDMSDYGMDASTVRALFAALREQLVPIVQAITAQPAADEACLRQRFPEAQQLAFGLETIKQIGYDFTRGRQDKTHHPFMIKFSLGDVRITTRFSENDLGNALFGTIHESGHALYEQGIRMDFEGTPLASGTSAGVHESQSRLWENIVGRSRGFWQFFYPRLQLIFPDQLGDVSLDTFYRAINKVERSLIRVDADEVTYNLHVMMRFDFELDLLEGRLAVRDLPEAWRERTRADMGIVPPDDRDGVLQDVHWYSGPIGGAFQGYTLGNILSAQLFESATRAHPAIMAEIAAGTFGTLHGWLKEQIYQHGRKFTAAELVERATGGPLSFEPYIRYLREKYGELYSL